MQNFQQQYSRKVITTGAWRVVLPENLWNMSNKQKYELKIKNKILFLIL